MNGNRAFKEYLIETYGEFCWLGDDITKDNQLTYHHIVPVRDGGKNFDPDYNGALLSRRMHDKFNKLEALYPDLADEINYFLVCYKGVYPEEVWKRIVKLLDLCDNRVKEEAYDGRDRRNFNRWKQKKRRSR